MSIWISQVPCVYHNFTSSKAEAILSAHTQSPSQMQALTTLNTADDYLYSCRQVCIYQWLKIHSMRKCFFFSLMKNHTKYFSNRIKIFNLKKKKVLVFGDHQIGWTALPMKKNWACKFIFLVCA